MKYTKLLGKTIKDLSTEIKLTSHKLLVRAGFIRESVAGRYFMLPLGMRVRDKVVSIIEKEMNKAGAQKMITPILHPLDLWKETNRATNVGFELMQIKDQRGFEFALGGTAEEMMVDVVRKFNLSYKNLPFNIYQFSQKFRDEKRARGGLLRTREFLMKDAYSFHVNEEDFLKEYEVMSNAYTSIFDQMSLETVKIESDNGYIGGDYCHEFVVESEIGESKFLITDDKKYAAHEEVVKFMREDMNPKEKLKELIFQEAKRGHTIADGVKLYNEPSWRQIKNVVYRVDDKDFVMVSLRGDLDISEPKLKSVLKCAVLKKATDEQIEKLGSKVGFISPLKIKIKKVGDLSLKSVKNFYTGGDKQFLDAINVNYERDFIVDIFADIALPPEKCKTEDGRVLNVSKGIEVGNIFQLGTHYSSKMSGATFVDKDGKEKPFYMGCYGIGVGRTVATIVEKHNDANGILWPKSVAPYDVHMLSIGDDQEVLNFANNIYSDLNNDLEVLFDDRKERPGNKFADADLVGIPIRIVISKRTLENNEAEVKIRGFTDTQMVSLEDLKEYVITQIEKL